MFKIFYILYVVSSGDCTFFWNSLLVKLKFAIYFMLYIKFASILYFQVRKHIRNMNTIFTYLLIVRLIYLQIQCLVGLVLVAELTRTYKKFCIAKYQITKAILDDMHILTFTELLTLYFMILHAYLLCFKLN